ncbi:MAG: TonB-dependent receptor, partial [Alphaproteobacteria bacterium]|nr:TonB-dependent receptor [Alphaproteobacteria bacterium]
GFIWIGTHDGLARYDGVSFRVWRTIPRDARSIAGNEVSALFVDRANRVWAGGEGSGLNVLDAARREFRRYRHDPADADSLAADDVWAVSEDASGAIWVGTYSGGLDRLREDGNGFEHHRADARSGLSSDIVLSLYGAADGSLWIGTDKGLVRRRPDGVFQRVPLLAGAPPPQVLALGADGAGVLVTTSSGLFRVDALHAVERLDPGAAPRNIRSSRLIPQVGGLFKLDDHFSIYARYAEGFKMPTAQQLYVSLPSTTFVLIPNPDLKPESVKSYEAGLRGRFDWGWFSIGAFHAQYKDFIAELQSLGFRADGVEKIGSINLSSVKLSGVEAATEVRIAENWLVNAALSYQYGEQIATPGAAKTPFNAALPFNGVFGVKWFKPDWNFDAELISRFSASMTRVTPSTNFKPPGYVVFDGFVNWKPWSNVTLRGGVMNILDKRYFQADAASYATTAAANVATVNPIELQTAPGRTFKASLTVDF